MKKTTHQVFKRIPKLKDQAARIELGRAHLIVFMLALALALQLSLSLQPGYVASRTLADIAIILLVIVGLFSLAVAISLYAKRK